MKAKLFYKINIAHRMLFVIILFIGCQKSEVEGENMTTKVTDSLSEEEKDWKEVKAAVLTFCDYPEECKKFYASTFWEKRVFEDSVHKLNRNVTKRFLHKYPQSDHYFQVLKYYFSYLVEPRFLNSYITQEKKAILDQEPKSGSKSTRSEDYQKLRALPYNNELRNKWLREGDSLVQNFLKTDAPTDQKAEIEVAKLARDKRMARFLYQYLDPDKKEEESEYWALFNECFWEDFINRMDQLVFKYPDYSEWPINIDLFIEGITLDFLAPEMKKVLWEHFREVMDKPELFEKHPVIAQIHQKAEENLEAIVAFKDFDENQPLQMKFTTMDGKKVNLEDYRGKVVLLDFWSIRCAPCIQEMPHVRALYNKYKSQGFEVIGISAEGDSAKERVLEITQKQGANWPQLLDKGGDMMVSYFSLFNIRSFPTVWLLNKEGFIIDKNARGNRLEPLIRKYLELDEEI